MPYKNRKQRNLEPAYVATLPVMDAVEAAIYLRTAPSTLSKYRMHGNGPAFIRQSSRKTLYRRTDLDTWLTSRSSTPLQHAGNA